MTFHNQGTRGSVFDQNCISIFARRMVLQCEDILSLQARGTTYHVYISQELLKYYQIEASKKDHSNTSRFKISTMDDKASPDTCAPKSHQDDESFKNDTVINATDVQLPTKSRMSAITTILTSGLALFSDGYNAQIIGYMNPVFAKLYPDSFSSSIKTRLSNAFLIGEVLGMLFFGYAIDRLGRRTGIVFATLFLVLGIILATAAHGKTELGMFWMMIVGRGVAGFGAGGKHSKGIGAEKIT